MRIRAFVWAGLFACWGAAQAAVPLPQLKIDAGQTSVSGVSSGGYMAVQLHVAYSATFKKGVGVVAAGPFNCAEGSVVDANQDGYYPQTTTQRQRPVGLRVVQTLKNSATPADTTFGLRRAYNCFWITL